MKSLKNKTTLCWTDEHSDEAQSEWLHCGNRWICRDLLNKFSRPRKKPYRLRDGMTRKRCLLLLQNAFLFLATTAVRRECTRDTLQKQLCINRHCFLRSPQARSQSACVMGLTNTYTLTYGKFQMYRLLFSHVYTLLVTRLYLLFDTTRYPGRQRAYNASFVFTTVRHLKGHLSLDNT